MNTSVASPLALAPIREVASSGVKRVPMHPQGSVAPPRTLDISSLFDTARFTAFDESDQHGVMHMVLTVVTTRSLESRAASVFHYIPHFIGDSIFRTILQPETVEVV